MTNRAILAGRRVAGVVLKETNELIRQPGLLAILVVGPLLILLLFGSGVRPTDPAARSIFVTPVDEPELAEVVRAYADTQSERLTIVDVTPDEDAAMRQLRNAAVDLVVVFPNQALTTVESGERAVIRVVHRYIDPLESQAIALFTRGAVSDLNDILLSLGVDEIQETAGGVLEDLDRVRGPLATLPDTEEIRVTLDDASVELSSLLELDPTVVAAPLSGESRSIGGAVTTSQFYAPAVVALILQHLTITFVALTRIREKELGTEELFAVSPLREAERLLGQSLAYLLVGGALAAVLLGAVAGLLGAPFRGGVGGVALVIVLELLASIGIGLALARLARSTTQVVQGAMLVLLTSVFFGGLLLSPERLLPWTRPIQAVLPMSHALRVLRDSMLRGVPTEASVVASLAVLAVVVLLPTAWLTIRDQRRR